MRLQSSPEAPRSVSGAYDEHTDDGGEIVLGHTPERVYDEAVYVAQMRGTEVTPAPGAMRVSADFDGTDVSMQVFLVPGNEKVARLKVTARSTFKGEPDVAKSVAEDIQRRLDS